MDILSELFNELGMELGIEFGSIILLVTFLEPNLETVIIF